MAEWLKAPVLKTDEGNTSGGSNPSFSVYFPYYVIIFIMIIKFFLFTVNFFSHNINTPPNMDKKYEVLLIGDFFLNKEKINNIKKAYEVEIKKELNMKNFYEDLELVIYIYYIIKSNFSTDIFKNIFGPIEAPKDLKEEEIFLFKMLVKINTLCELIYKNIKFDNFYEKNENYEDSNVYYNCLILEGAYINKIPNINIFKDVGDLIFYEDLQKFEKKHKLKGLRVFYQKSNKILKNKFNRNDKTFRIILHTTKILPINNYEMDVFTFNNKTEASKNLRILKENPSINVDIFKKHLTANKVVYEYNDANISNEQVGFEMNHLLNKKNIKEKFALENRIFIIKSKSYNREPLKNFPITEKDMYIIVKKKLLKRMKNHGNLLKLIEKENKK